MWTGVGRQAPLRAISTLRNRQLSSGNLGGLLPTHVKIVEVGPRDGLQVVKFTAMYSLNRIE